MVAFLGRRNPNKTDHDYAGPKYLNTKTTPVFTKGEALFGYHEARDALANGALPVIVEGPIDAYAITLGSAGTAVGIAPMGTALTVGQIELLRRHIRLAEARHRIAVATDADAAGWKAAQTAFWNLTAADLDPTYIALPDGLDPADFHTTHGPQGIQAAIANRTPLGDAMLEQTLRTAGHWSDPAVRQQIVEYAAAILAARGPDTWNDSINKLNQQLHLSPGILEHRTLEASIARDLDAIGYAQARISQLQARARAGVPTRIATTAPTRTHESAEPTRALHPRPAPAPGTEGNLPRR